MSECKIIALINQKGGVGKTTTAVNLGVGLANLGKKVLMIDNDPQANLTMSLGYDQPDELEYTLYDVMDDILHDEDISENHIIHTSENVDLIPSCIELASMEQQLITAISRENVLKSYINNNGIREKYDYVLIDCQPSLGILSTNALNAADSIIIPTQPQYFSTKGLVLLLKSVSRAKKLLNPNLKFDGILMTMVNGRANISKEFVSMVKDTYGNHIKVFDTQIPQSVKASEATSEGVSVFSYAPNSKVANAYENFVKEVFEIGEKEKKRNSPEFGR